MRNCGKKNNILRALTFCFVSLFPCHPYFACILLFIYCLRFHPLDIFITFHLFDIFRSPFSFSSQQTWSNKSKTKYELKSVERKFLGIWALCRKYKIAFHSFFHFPHAQTKTEKLLSKWKNSMKSSDTAAAAAASTIKPRRRNVLNPNVWIIRRKGVSVLGARWCDCVCVLYHYIGECWHHNSLRVENGTRGKTIKEMKRHHQAQTHKCSSTHTPTFFYSCQIIFLIWFLFALSTHTISVGWLSFVRSCFVLLLLSTAFITSNGYLYVYL